MNRLMSFCVCFVLSFTIVTLIDKASAHHTTSNRCPAYKQTALAAGWTEAEWPRLDYIIWRESRCNPRVRNTRGRDDSYGLMQLNMRAHRSWVGPIVNWNYNALYDPYTNLQVARTLYTKAARMFGCGWHPWKTRSNNWCR